MPNQLDISTAPGWLRRMWKTRQRVPGRIYFTQKPIEVYWHGTLIGYGKTDEAALALLTAYMKGKHDRQ